MKRYWQLHLAFGTLAVILSLCPVRADEALERAIELTAEQRYSEAREVLDSVLERRPDYSYARLLHGILRARAGRLDDAIAVFEQLRNDHPDMPEPYNNLAVLYAVQGRLDDAREVLVAMVEREPNAIAYANLGDVYAGLARRAYERARALDPDGEVLAGARLDPKNRMPEIPPRSSITAAMRTGPSDDGPVPPDKAAVLPGARMGSSDATAFVLGNARPSPSDGTSRRELPVDQPEHTMKPPESGGETRVLLTAAAVTVAEPPIGVASAGAPDGVGSAVLPEQSAVMDEPSSICARVLGFRDRRAVADASRWLSARGVEVMGVHDDRHEVTTSYRVFLPPFASRDEAFARLREIRERGVVDVAVIESGDQASGVSFGVYANIENVRRRVSALRDFGYEVRTGAATVEVIEGFTIAIRARSSLQDLESAWAPELSEHPIQPVECG